MKIEEDVKLDFSDVLIRPKRSSLESRRDVNLKRELKMLHTGKTLKGIPVMNSNMGTCGTFDIALALYNNDCFSTVHKFHDYKTWASKSIFGELKDENHDLYDFVKKIFFPIGMDEYSLENYRNYRESRKYTEYTENIMVDVANGYSESFVNYIRRIREEFPEAVIAAGNVATADMTEALILAGADLVKVGIGGGSACTTRLKAGVGYPQLSSIIYCADAAHGLGGHIIADGGCNCVADFCKALGGGADIVMSGSFFAGTDESDAEETEVDGVKYKVNYGMSSKTAQEKFGDGLKEYRSSEGRTTLIPATGPVEDVIKDILGGIRSCCTYVGAKAIKELPKRTTFIKVNNTHNQVNESSTIGS